MNTETGQILDYDKIPVSERKHWVPCKRDLTLKERSDKQVQKYSPCVCGSGKKAKFCCLKK